MTEIVTPGAGLVYMKVGTHVEVDATPEGDGGRWSRYARGWSSRTSCGWLVRTSRRASRQSVTQPEPSRTGDSRGVAS
jgi:hypothetical protein